MLLRKVLLLGVCLLAVNNSKAVSEDEYLNNIDQYVETEASKLEASQQPDRGMTSNSVMEMKNNATGRQSKGEFEAFLKHRHGGTLSLYQSLSEQDQLKVYEEFSAGMPMKKIRRLVIQLKLKK